MTERWDFPETMDMNEQVQALATAYFTYLEPPDASADTVAGGHAAAYMLLSLITGIFDEILEDPEVDYREALGMGLRPVMAMWKFYMESWNEQTLKFYHDRWAEAWKAAGGTVSND